MAIRNTLAMAVISSFPPTVVAFFYLLAFPVLFHEKFDVTNCKPSTEVKRKTNVGCG